MVCYRPSYKRALEKCLVCIVCIVLFHAFVLWCHNFYLSVLFPDPISKSYNNGSSSSVDDRAEINVSSVASSWVKNENLHPESNSIGDERGKCSRLLLLKPLSGNGHGSQFNNYLLAVLAAAYFDRALLLVEPGHPCGSQFGCPEEAYVRGDNNDTDATSLRKDFPMGFSSLVNHPQWISRGCKIPVTCDADQTQYGWNENVKCTRREDDGSNTTVDVVVYSGFQLRSMISEKADEMIQRDGTQKSIDLAYRWAHNLGATAKEATYFASDIRERNEIYDYVIALTKRSGFLGLQPWIERDVDSYLKTMDLPMGEDYAAIHVRRGDKLVSESRGEVREYWKSQGYSDMENLPKNYIPFSKYLESWDGPESCPRDVTTGEPKVVKHHVYVATDDPKEVRQEIRDLPGHTHGDDHPYTVLWNTCHELRFYFAPVNETWNFHIHNGNADCSARYRRNIVSMGDLMLLVRAKMSIIEYNSNWGRVIRVLRFQMNSTTTASDVDSDGSAIKENVALPLVLDTRHAWGASYHDFDFPGW